VAATTPNVGALRLDGADRPHLAILEESQELHLEPDRKIADLVEEKRAHVRELDEAGLVPRESAPVKAPLT
jgi:hypothetical protein